MKIEVKEVYICGSVRMQPINKEAKMLAELNRRTNVTYAAIDILKKYMEVELIFVD